MSKITKEIAEVANVSTSAKVSKAGDAAVVAEYEKECNKKTSINQIIESALELPTIENDATFGALWASAPSDIVRNGLKAAWANMPNIKAAFDLSLSDIVSKCEGSSVLVGSHLSEALRLITDYSKELGGSLVIFKECNKDTKEFRPVTVLIRDNREVVCNMVVEVVEAGKDTLNKRVAALASAYRLSVKANRGVKSLGELQGEAMLAVAKVKNLMSAEDFEKWLEVFKG